MKAVNKITGGVSVIVGSFLLMVVSSCHKGKSSYSFETATFKKGSIINTITATGTIEADTTVLIGTQVSGVIKKIFVDFNSVVRKGQLLAELDTTPLRTQIRQAEATLDDSKGEGDFRKPRLKDTRPCLIKNLLLRQIMIRLNIVIRKLFLT